MQRNIGNEYDITGTVRVNRPEDVRNAVIDILGKCYPGESFQPVEAGFEEFNLLFSGELPDYKGCDTLYHDLHHTLDMTLAMARLTAGYEQRADPTRRLGARRASLGLIAALFHDSGYILHKDDDVEHGAEYTQTHVSRSAAFVEAFTQRIGLGEDAATARRLVHFTGYEIPPAEIPMNDPRDRVVGELLGTADLMAQMADRCYLEKCRDRLFPEFVIGGLAVEDDGDGGASVLYRSGTDLLRHTPEFFQNIFEKRLEGEFGSAYRHFEGWFDGANPYLDGIKKNLDFLQRVLDGERWELLRRRPPTTGNNNGAGENDTHRLAVQRLRELLADDSGHDDS